MTAPTDAREAERLAGEAMAETVVIWTGWLMGCPLCGSSEAVDVGRWLDFEPPVYGVSCGGCGLTLDCRASSEAQAPALWNRRAALAHPRGEPARAEGTEAVVEAARDYCNTSDLGQMGGALMRMRQTIARLDAAPSDGRASE